MPNCAEFIATNLACAQAGWYLVPINWHLAPAEIAYILQDSEAKAFIAHERIADVARAAADEIGFPAASRFAIGAIPGFRPFADLVKGQPTTLPGERAAGAVMNYTSGTTGKPKGVRRPLAPLDPDTLATLFTGFLAMFGIKPEDGNVHIVGSPLYHTAVLVFGSASMNMGHPVVLMEKWTPEECLRLIEGYRVTTSHMVPTQFHRMLALPPDVRAKYDCSSTRTMVHAAAPCPPDVKRRMLDWWGDSIFEYYAATEGGGTLVTPQEWRQYPGTVGKAWPGADIKIYDDDANEVAPGPTGNGVHAAGPGRLRVPQGQGEDAQEPDRQLLHGRRRRLPERGRLPVPVRPQDRHDHLGRRQHLPRRDRERAARAPEDRRRRGVRDPERGLGRRGEGGDRARRRRRAGPGARRRDPRAGARDKLAKFKTPKTIDFIAELPRDPNGKLYKRKLRDPYWANRERAI